VSYPQKRLKCTIRKVHRLKIWTSCPWVSKVYQRDLDFRRYNVPFLLNPYIAFYTSRGVRRSAPSVCGRRPFGSSLAFAFGSDIANECRYVWRISRG